MTAPRRVQQHRAAENKRRQVRTTGVNRLGKRTVAPRQKPPARKRGRYRKSTALAGLSVLFSGFSYMTGSIFWAVGACAGAAGSSIAWRIEHRRQLAEVKATGKPIGAKDPAPAARRTDDLEPVPEPKPVDLDTPPARQPGFHAPPAPQPRRSPQRKGGDHLSRCQANPPGGPTCRCVDGPNRAGAKRKTTAKRATPRRKP